MAMLLGRWALTGLLLLAGGAGRGATLSTANDGVRIDAGTLGAFTLAYPALDLGDDAVLRPVSRELTAHGATLRYGGGATAHVTLDPDGSIGCSFTSPPPGLKRIRVEMLIDFGFSDGGTWRAGGDIAHPFPRTKPEKPHLLQGNTETFEFRDRTGRGLSITVPPYTYQQLTDNREWNWKIFNWTGFVPIDPALPRCRFAVRELAPGGPPPVVVDRLGQDAAMDFPGKARNETDLKADIAAEEAYLAGLRPPARDAWGGLPGTRAKLGLNATGYFHVENRGGRWWLVNPSGNATFHMGICGFQPSDDYTYIKDRRQAYAWLPDHNGPFRAAFHPDSWWSQDAFSFFIANQIRKFGVYDPEALRSRMIGRVRRMGFNAMGAFSSESPAQRAARFPWVATLPLGQWSLGGQIEGLRGLFDPFDPLILAKMDGLFAKEVAPRAADPLLIGYFLDNEQAFEDIVRVVPGMPGDRPARRQLTTMLERKYRTIGALNAAWGLRAASFEGLAGIPLVATTPSAAADLNDYAALFIEAYYRVVRTTFRKYDAHHMLIGNRWQPTTANNEQLCRIAGKYCDALSLNYYTAGIDAAYLRRLYAWSGKRPFILSEFYWASPAESGLPGGNELTTQRERGLAYRNYLEQAAATGFVVGIEWFTLIDQARTGRFFERYSGENANTGLFSVVDRPYRDFTTLVAQTNFGIYDVLLGKRQPWAWDDPRFVPRGQAARTVRIPRATGPIRLDGTRSGWPGTPPELVPPARLVMGATTPGFEGAFRLCWDDTNLYVMASVQDPTPCRNGLRGADIWNGDAVELFLGPEEAERGGSLRFGDRQVLLSAAPASGDLGGSVLRGPAPAGVKVFSAQSSDGRGYVLEAAIPFSALGFRPRAGQAIRFDVAIDDGAGEGRKRQLMWNGGARNSGDRTDWGRATFMP